MRKVALRKLCIEGEYGNYGIPAPAEDYDNLKVRYLRITDISDEGNLLNDDKKSVSAKDIEKYILKEGDIVFARTGNSTGRAYYHEDKNGELAYAGFLIKYTLDPLEVNPKYLRYFTISKEYKKWVNNLSVGSTRGNINAQTFADCPVSLPERIQQNLMVSVLSSLDAKIELNNRINAELEAMAKTLYDYWFVQFDFPDANGKPYKSSGGKMVWNEELVKNIPAEWEVKIVENVLQTSLGGTPSTSKKSYWENGTINWLNSGEIESFPIIESLEKITPEAIKNSATKLLPKGSVVISITRYIRPSILAIDSCANQSVVGILESHRLKSSFLYPYFKNEVPRFMVLRTGANQPHINKQTIDESLIIYPSDDVLDAYYSIATPVYTQIINNAFQSKQLTELRDWLLPMLMNGQVTVKEAATLVEAPQPVNIAAEPAAVYQKHSLVVAIPEAKQPFAKRVLGGKIVSLFKDDPHFTHIKFQKLQFLAEHAMGANLHWNYYFQSAGPYDPAFMHTVADKLKESGWYEERNFKFYPLGKEAKIEDYYNNYFGPATEKLSELFSLLAHTTEAETEIIATVYAVWNNRIIQQQPISDAALIEDFYNWSERKAAYTHEQIVQALQWLRTHHFIPTGFGKEIKRVKIKR